MTLMDAQQYDEARERRRKLKISIAILVIVAVSVLLWMNRYWPERHVADSFFAALQKQDYPAAYRIYHPDTTKYPYNEFYQDWGPGGEWGLVKTYSIYGVSGCPGGGSGVVVDVIVNNRAEHAQVWVEKSDKTLSTPPCSLEFR
ncbi:MAG: hypothetical protein LAO03_05430 [Acidobacteriia bacterium]|nr:hypothetical protein [Terriglobia bacterium]